MMEKSNKMEKNNKKSIQYKTDEDRQTTHVIVKMTEGLKKSIKETAKKEGKTMSEMLRQLALQDNSGVIAMEKATKKEKKPKKKIAWNNIVPIQRLGEEPIGYTRSYLHQIIWHDVKSEVPEDAARGYDIDINTDGCKLLLLVKVKEDGRTYLELEHGWYDGKIDRNRIVVDKDMEGKVVAYSFTQAIEPLYIFNEMD
jgi:hypothetical protein